MSSATALSGEIEGRTYGGGVLKLEPSEAKRLLIPIPSMAKRKRLSDAVPTLDALIRSGKWGEARRRVDLILELAVEDVDVAADALRARRLGLGDRRRAQGSAATGD